MYYIIYKYGNIKGFKKICNYDSLCKIFYDTDDCNDEELTDYKESDFIDLLISFIQDFENKVAVQVYSIQVLTKFVHQYPELKEEILEVIVLHSENKSPAFSASLRKFLRKTKNI